MFQSYRYLAAVAIGALAAATGSTAVPSVARAENTSVSEGTTLPTVLVTARRREENLQDTPISVTALSAEALARQNITSTDQLDLVTPGLEFANYGPLSGNNSAAQVFIRGIGQTDPTAAVDPGVGIYVDDVYMGRAIGGVMEFRDIDSVQVLRGPQGTLFGRNTIGGAILVKTKDPTNELGADFRVKTGTGNLIEGFGALNVPLTEDLATRITGGVRKRDGYVTRIVDGIDLGNDNTATFTGKTLWTPTDTLRVEIKGDYTREKENGSPFVFKAINEAAVFPIAVSVGAGCPGASFPPPVPVPNINDPRCANNYWYKGRYTNGGTAAVNSYVKNWGFSGHVDWNASNWLTLKSITAYRDLHWRGARDADNTPFVILDTAIDSSTSQFSQEFQGLLDFGRVNGVVGAYYFDEIDRRSVESSFLAAGSVRSFGHDELQGSLHRSSDHQELRHIQSVERRDRSESESVRRNPLHERGQDDPGHLDESAGKCPGARSAVERIAALCRSPQVQEYVFVGYGFGLAAIPLEPQPLDLFQLVTGFQERRLQPALQRACAESGTGALQRGDRRQLRDRRSSPTWPATFASIRPRSSRSTTICSSYTGWAWCLCCSMPARRPSRVSRPS